LSFLLASRLPKSLGPLIEKTSKMSVHIDETIPTVRRIPLNCGRGTRSPGFGAALECRQTNFKPAPASMHGQVLAERRQSWTRILNTAFFRIFQETPHPQRASPRRGPTRATHAGEVHLRENGKSHLK